MLGKTTDYFNIILNILTSEQNYNLSNDEIDIILDEEAFNYTIIAILTKFITIQEIEELDSVRTNEIIDRFFMRPFKWNDENRKLKAIRNYMSHDDITAVKDSFIFNGNYISGVVSKKEFIDFLFSMFENNREDYLNMILLITKIRQLVMRNNKTISLQRLVSANSRLKKFALNSKSVELINSVKYTNVFSVAKKRIKLNQLDAEDINMDNICYSVYYSPEYKEREQISLQEYIEKQRKVISEFAFNAYKLGTAKDKRITLSYYEKMNENLAKKALLEEHKANSEKFRDMAIEKLDYLNSYGTIMPSNWEFIRRLRNGFVHNSFSVNNDTYYIEDNNDEIPMSFKCALSLAELEDLSEQVIIAIENRELVRTRS